MHDHHAMHNELYNHTEHAFFLEDKQTYRALSFGPVICVVQLVLAECMTELLILSHQICTQIVSLPRYNICESFALSRKSSRLKYVFRLAMGR